MEGRRRRGGGRSDQSGHRVDQLRLEAGVSPLADSQESKEELWKVIQMESLGSCRRNQISTLEYPKERRRHGPSLSTVEAARLSNRPGTQENRDSQANQAQLSAWNTVFNDLQDDGTVGEDLGDINSGQSHRFKLMQECSPHAFQLEGSSGPNHHPRGGPRGRNGGRGGRGGGNVGSQSARHGLKRIPAGTSAPSDLNRREEQNPTMPQTPSTERLNDVHSPPPTPRRSREKRRKAKREHTSMPIPETPVPEVTARINKSPVPMDWNLADPETFMAVVKKRSASPAAIGQGAGTKVVQAAPSPTDQSLTSASQGGALSEVRIGEQKTEILEAGNVAHSYSETLVSTGTETLKTDDHGIAPPLAAVKESHTSYSSDLLCLKSSPTKAAGDNTQPQPIETIDIAVEPEKDDTMVTDTQIKPEKALVDFCERLAHLLPTLRNKLKPDLAPLLDTLYTQLKENIEKSSSAVASPNSPDVVPQFEEVHPRLQEEIKGSTSSADMSNQKANVVQVAASNQELTGGDVPAIALKEVSSVQVKAISSAVPEIKEAQQLVVDNKSWGKDTSFDTRKPEDVDMIFGPQMLPGRLHRHGLNRSASVTSATSDLLLSPTPSVSSAIAPLATKFGRLSLNSADEGPPVSKFAAFPPGSVTTAPSRPGMPWPLLENVPLQIFSREGPSASRFIQRGSEDHLSLVPTHQRKAFNLHEPVTTPSGESMLNRTGHSRLATASTSGQSPSPNPTRDPLLGSARTGPSMMNSTGFFRNQKPPAASSSQLHPSAPGTPPSQTAPRVAPFMNVFKTTHSPSGPSQMNQTGFYRRENQK